MECIATCLQMGLMKYVNNSMSSVKQKLSMNTSYTADLTCRLFIFFSRPITQVNRKDSVLSKQSLGAPNSKHIFHHVKHGEFSSHFVSTITNFVINY